MHVGSWFMRRDPRAYLWDIQQGCVHVRAFLAEIEFDEYLASDLVRSAVERQLQNVGEALAQLSRADPQLAERVPEYRQLIAFRNVLVHGYAALDHLQVWRAIAESLPSLHAAVDALLTEVGPTQLP